MKCETTERRSYDQKARAVSVAATHDRICAAARAAFACEPYERVTLEQIAQAAAVRIPTLLRHFTNKEQLFLLIIQQWMMASQETRGPLMPTSLPVAVDAIVNHFEQHGALIIHFLMQEAQVPAIRTITESGRSYHRQWVSDLLRPFVPPRSSEDEVQLWVQLWAITDVWFWHTLRHTLGQSSAMTSASIQQLIEGIVAQHASHTDAAE